MNGCLKVSRVFVVTSVNNVANTLKACIGDVKDPLKVIELSQTENANGSSKSLETAIPEIEYLFADPSVIGQVLLHPKNSLKWAQCTFAGLDAIFKALEQLQKIPDVKISRQTSGFGQMMGEYVIGHIIARERKFEITNELQKLKTFDCSQVQDYRSLSSLSLGILGLGTIGKEVARQCKAMNMTVWGIVRDERYDSGHCHYDSVDNLLPFSRLNEMLADVDYLVNVLPSTPKTRGLLNGTILQFCERKKTVFINIGRGDIIDDSSLITSIKKGWLGGAILDVFNTEPLPCSNELWNLPNVTITPHVGGVTFAKQAVETFLKNLQLYQEDKPLINQVDFLRGY